jgi:hypothetical protein
MPTRYILHIALVCLPASFAFSITPGIQLAPNSDATYQQLRTISVGSEAVTISDFTLRRDAARFHLHSGTVCFLVPVQGKVTGAVFAGEGNVVVNPPLQSEIKSISRLSKGEEFSENFGHLVLRFTDDTYEEIKKAGKPATNGVCDVEALQDSQNALRKKVRYNLTARILQDVLSTETGKLFVAFIRGTRYNDKIIYAIDPHGAPQFAESVFRDDAMVVPLAPEEVVLMTYDENKFGYWGAFHLTEEYKNGTATGSQQNEVLQIESQQLDTTIDKNAYMHGKATTTIVSRVNGLRVLPFDLYRTLRVEGVTDKAGEPLNFIQEDKTEDYQFFVILPQPLAQGEKFTLTTIYNGKEAVFNEGNGNYFPVARENWYPNRASAAYGSYSSYDLTFRIPKGLEMAATGDLISKKEENGKSVTLWKSAVPLTVAGFNFGRFKKQEATIPKSDFLVQAFANEEPPDMIRPLVGLGALGTLSTVAMMKKPLAEGEVAVELYTDYFGPLPFKRLAMTQQTACTFGQAWPQLVWLPICSFFDSTQRHQFGLDYGDRGYWKIVAPHEVAHQWWGHAIGFNSYRDQWMSEGFAEMSASLFLQMVEHDPKKFIEFWNDERELVLQKNQMGFRGIDAGALTMGYRAGNTKTGVSITRDLIYPKGAYILHMIRMMMWSKQYGDQSFKDAMHDFVKTYSGRAATTEDFKAMIEKHMTADMLNVSDGQKNMDWFFDEYVYGTALPTYKFEYSFENPPDGTTLFNFKITQSGVDEKFRMAVPIYMEMANGRAVLLGRAKLVGNTSFAGKVRLGVLKDKPKGAVINHFDDVLATSN